MKYRLDNISGGEAGTDQTVRAIGNLIQSSLRRQKIRIFTISILDRKNVSSHNQKQVAFAVHSWVKQNIRYINDPVDLETIQEPDITLQLKAGDCDDHAALVATMLESVGITTRLKVVGRSVDLFAHIYPEALIGGDWIAVDTAIQAPFGTAVKMLQNKIYNSKGDVMKTIVYGDGLGRVAPEITRIPLDVIKKQFYNKTQQVLRSNWNRGRINLADVNSYLTVIDDGNSPTRFTIAEAPARAAIADFKKMVISKNIQSGKPMGTLNGMEGIDGLFSSIWKGIKSVAGGAINLVTGGGGSQQPIIVNPPTINLPESIFKTEVSPGAARAGVAEMMSNPILWVAVAALVITVIRK